MHCYRDSFTLLKSCGVGHIGLLCCLGKVGVSYLLAVGADVDEALWSHMRQPQTA
jgi:hypothetical protein